MNQLQETLDENFPELQLEACRERSKKEKHAVVVHHHFGSQFFLTELEARTLNTKQLRNKIIKMLADEIRFVSVTLMEL